MFNKKKSKINNSNYKILDSKIPTTILVKNFDTELYKKFLIKLRTKGMSRMVANKKLLEQGWKNFINEN